MHVIYITKIGKEEQQLASQQHLCGTENGETEEKCAGVTTRGATRRGGGTREGGGTRNRERRRDIRRRRQERRSDGPRNTFYIKYIDR